MLSKIIAYSVRNPLVVLLGVVAMSFFGWQSLSNIPLDAVPDITNNQVQIVTQSPSLSAEEVEQFITYPLELTMINLPGVVDVRSISKFGLSILTVIFEENVPDLNARQLVAEQLAIASADIPENLGIPQMMPITTGLGEIYQYILTVDPASGKSYSITELRTLQDWLVKRQLGGIEGVIEISSFGGFTKQYEVVPSPEKLAHFGISLSDLSHAIAQNNESRGGSYYSKNNQSFYVRAQGRLQEPSELLMVPIKSMEAGTVYLRDVATLKEGHAIRFGAMTKDGIGEVVGGISLMLKGENAHATIERIEERVAQVQQSLPEGVHIEPYLVRSELVDRTTATVAKNLIEGGIIVILVLVLLLGNIRAGLVVASIIPLAMLFALILMNAFGVSANLMSLGAIDFGIVVDGAVIITEHIIAVLAVGYMGKKLSTGEFQEVVIKSSLEMVKSAVFGVMIILVVFIPIITLVGIEGKMFRPMAQTVSFALLGALLLSITYVPAVLTLVMKPMGVQEPKFSRWIVDSLQRRYNPTLDAVLRRPMPTFIMAAVLFGWSVWTFTNMGSEFIPKLDEGDIAVQLQLPPGTALSESVATTTETERALLEHFPEVRTVVSKIGTAEVPTDPMSVEQADIMVLLNPKDQWPVDRDKEALINEMASVLESSVPHAEFEFTQPIELRFNELISGAKSDVAIKVFGTDFDELLSIAEEIVPIVEQVPGAVDVKREQTDGLNQRHIVYDRQKMSALGVDIAAANIIIEAAFAGSKASTFYESDKRFDIVIRFDEGFRNQPNLSELTVRNAEGSAIPLAAFAQMEYHDGPAQISRENSQRRIVVSCNVRGRDIESVVLDIQKRLAQVDMPPGYFLSYGGDFEQLQEAKHRLSLAVPIALAAIFILLFLSFRSMNLAAMVFVSVPLSSIGGVAALYLRGMPFSISAGIGFIALFGVAVLNGIVMISHLSNAVKDPKNIEEIKGAARQRLRPVIMTAFVAALGFLPMALSTGSGAEVQKPLATVVIGGLITATLLTLVVLPVVYMRFGRFKKAESIALITALLFLAPQTGRSQSDRNFTEALESMKANNIAIQMSEAEVQRVRSANAQQWNAPFSAQWQQGQINTDVHQDYFFTAEVELPSISAAPALLALHRARMTSAKAQAKYVALVQETLLHQQWKAYESKLLWIQAKSRQYENAERIHERVKRRVASGLLPMREMSRWEVMIEELHHEIKAAQSEAFAIKSNIDAMVGWNPNDAWAPAAMITPVILPMTTADQAMILQPMFTESDLALHAFKLEKSSWLPRIGVGAFTQKMEGAPGLNGVQFSASMPLSPHVYQQRLKEEQLNKFSVDLSLEQAVREWQSVSAKLYQDLQRWEPEAHHGDSQWQTQEALWSLYEAGALDLESLWGHMSAKTNSEVLGIEHQYHYQKTIIEWNFYQTTAW